MSKTAIPATAKRVMLHTDRRVNEKIHAETLSHIEKYKGKSPEEITRRIDELGREWDIERALETSASGFVIIGVVMGYFFSSLWFAFPGIIGVFLLGHAIEGWCPPLPIFRKLGIRTPSEINNEITVLRYLRGDFNHSHQNVDKILDP